MVARVAQTIDAPTAARHTRARDMAAAGQQRMAARKRQLEDAAEPDGRQRPRVGDTSVPSRIL